MFKKILGHVLSYAAVLFLCLTAVTGIAQPVCTGSESVPVTESREDLKDALKIENPGNQISPAYFGDLPPDEEKIP